MVQEHAGAITSEERRKLGTYLTETRERLLRLTQSLTPIQLIHKPAPNRWSVADNLEHVTVVESLVLDRVNQALQEAPDPSRQSAWHGRDEALIQSVENHADRLEAPELIQPARRQYQELFQQLEAVRQRTCEFVAETSAELRGHYFAHPVYGELDCYQWLLTMGAHFERHRVQIEEILAAPRFPRALDWSTILGAFKTHIETARYLDD